MRTLLLSVLAGSVALAAPAAEQPPRASSTAQSRSAPSPKALLRTAMAYRDVPLQMRAFSSRATGKIRVTIVTEAGVPGTRLTAAAAGLYDATGKLVSEWAATAAELAAPALVAAFDQPAGQYRARVAVTNAAGRAGTADVDVDAHLTPAASGLSLSSMLIGTMDRNFAPRLQFRNEPAATAYFEIYGGKPGMPVVVAVELAPSLNGPAIATLKPSITASPEPDKHLVTTPIDLAALPPGDYIVRAIVGVDGFTETRIAGTLRKTQ